MCKNTLQRSLAKSLCVIEEQMKELIIISILFAPILSIAQESVNKESKFSVGVNFSPNYSYRTLKYPDNLQSFVDDRERSEHPSFGFNTGIAVQYLLMKKFEVELCIQFSRQTHMLKEVTVVGTMGNVSMGLADVQLRYHYIEIPILVNYRIVNQKFFGYISAGVSINQFLNDESKAWLTYSNGDNEVVHSESGILDFNKTVVGLVGGVGLGYHISEKLNLRVEPLFRYSLAPLAEAPIDQYNYSIGCQIGMNVKL